MQILWCRHGARRARRSNQYCIRKLGCYVQPNNSWIRIRGGRRGCVRREIMITISYHDIYIFTYEQNFKFPGRAVFRPEWNFPLSYRRGVEANILPAKSISLLPCFAAHYAFIVRLSFKRTITRIIAIRGDFFAGVQIPRINPSPNWRIALPINSAWRLFLCKLYNKIYLI